MSSQQYDVVVGGGSFGGLAAGKEAAEKGRKTLVLERGDRRFGFEWRPGC